MGLDTVELVMAFEENFGIEISNEAAEAMITVRDVRDFIAAEYQRQHRSVDPEAIFEKIRDITVAHLNVRPEIVTLDASFVEDLGAD